MSFLPAPLLWQLQSAGTQTLGAALLCPGVSGSSAITIRSDTFFIFYLKDFVITSLISAAFPLFNRWANPAYRPRCMGVSHGSHDWGVPSIWHEPFHEHSHLHQLLNQQLDPWDWTWVTSPPKAARWSLSSVHFYPKQLSSSSHMVSTFKLYHLLSF